MTELLRIAVYMGAGAALAAVLSALWTLARRGRRMVLEVQRLDPSADMDFDEV